MPIGTLRRKCWGRRKLNREFWESRPLCQASTWVSPWNYAMQCQIAGMSRRVLFSANGPIEMRSIYDISRSLLHGPFRLPQTLLHYFPLLVSHSFIFKQVKVQLQYPCIPADNLSIETGNWSMERQIRGVSNSLIRQSSRNKRRIRE